MAQQQITMSPSDFLNQPDQQQTQQQTSPAAQKVQPGDNPTISVSDWNKLPAPQTQVAQAPPKWVPQDNDYVAEIQTSDGQSHIIHGDDLAEAQRRDPTLKIISQPQTYRDYARGRTLMNMTRAMAGQKMDRPEDEAEGERGREAGMKAAALDTALTLGTLGVGELFRPGVQVAEETSSLLGPEGRPVVKQVLKKGPSSAGHIVNAVKDALPEQATLEQAMKVARIVYHLGIGTGGAAYLWHELFGGK